MYTQIGTTFYWWQQYVIVGLHCTTPLMIDKRQRQADDALFIDLSSLSEPFFIASSSVMKQSTPCSAQAINQ